MASTSAYDPYVVSQAEDRSFEFKGEFGLNGESEKIDYKNTSDNLADNEIEVPEDNGSILVGFDVDMEAVVTGLDHYGVEGEVELNLHTDKKEIDAFFAGGPKKTFRRNYEMMFDLGGGLEEDEDNDIMNGKVGAGVLFYKKGYANEPLLDLVVTAVGGDDVVSKFKTEASSVIPASTSFAPKLETSYTVIPDDTWDDKDGVQKTIKAELSGTFKMDAQNEDNLFHVEDHSLDLSAYYERDWDGSRDHANDINYDNKLDGDRDTHAWGGEVSWGLHWTPVDAVQATDQDIKSGATFSLGFNRVTGIGIAQQGFTLDGGKTYVPAEGIEVGNGILPNDAEIIYIGGPYEELRFLNYQANQLTLGIEISPTFHEISSSLFNGAVWQYFNPIVSYNHAITGEKMSGGILTDGNEKRRVTSARTFEFGIGGKF